MDILGVFYQFLPLVVVILGGALILIVKKFVNQYTQNSNLDQKAKISNFVTGLVVDGVFYAEQEALKLAKQNQQLVSDGKLYMATDYVITQLTKAGIVEFTQQEIANRIEAFLGSNTFEMNNMKKIDSQMAELMENMEGDSDEKFND